MNHGIAVDKADAAVQAIEAGMDMDMSSDSYIENLTQLVEEGKVSRELSEVKYPNFMIRASKGPFKRLEN